MRVPTRINPQTEPVAERQPYLQAHGLDWSGLAQQAQGLAGDIRANQLRREEFDLNSEFIRETNELAKDFEQRAEVADLGAAGFTERLETDYTARHQALTQRYKDQGYSEQSLQRFDMQLGELRNRMYARGVQYQATSARVNANVKIADLGTQLSQYTSVNPDAIISSLDVLEHNVRLMPGLTAPEQAEIIAREQPGIIMSAGWGIARTRPRDVIRALDPGALAVRGLSGRSQNPWANVAIDVANEFGLNPVELAAIMSFETGGSFNPAITNATGHLGLIQFGKAEQDLYRITPNSTPGEWTAAISKFFHDRGLKPGASIEDVYSTILTGSPGNYDAADSNGTTVRNAVPRILSQHLAKADAWLGEREQVAQEDVPEPSPDGKTGITALDLMDAHQRAQVLAWAKNTYNQNDAAAKAAVRDKIENEQAALQTTGQSAVTVTDEEFAILGPGAQTVAEQTKAMRVAGPVVAGMATASAAQLQAQVEALRPTDSSAPDYSERMAVYNAVEAAKQRNLKAREQDPRSYVAAAFPQIQAQAAAATNPAQRRAAYIAIAGAYRQLGIPPDQWLPVPKDQVAAVRAQYDGMPPQSKLAQIKSWYNELTGTGMYVPFMTQMNSNGTGPGYDGFMYSTLINHPQRDSTMVDVLNGQARIREDPAQKPDPSVMNKAFAGNTGIGKAISQINPTASVIYNEMAAAIYVAHGGRVDRGNIVDPALYRDSVRRAVGGLADNADSGIVNFHGSRNTATILPPAVTRQQWERWLDGLTPGSLTRISRDKLPPLNKFGKPVLMQDIKDEGIFIMRAPGQYAIQFATDGGTLRTARGTEYIVNIKPETVR